VHGDICKAFHGLISSVGNREIPIRVVPHDVAIFDREFVKLRLDEIRMFLRLQETRSRRARMRAAGLRTAWVVAGQSLGRKPVVYGPPEGLNSDTIGFNDLRRPRSDPFRTTKQLDVQ
jgi:hypothetical protein